ncbi:MAG: DUF885 domain-containing protein [Candidatus Odinarchaeota archaeon]
MREDQRFVDWTNNFFEEFLRENPGTATFFGKHDYDHLLGDGSKEHTIRMYEKFMATWKEMKETFDRSKLSFHNQIDYDLLDHSGERQKFEFETLQTWKTGYNGGGPVGGIGGSLFSLLTGEFAPFEKRAESMVGRMERIPEFLEQSKNTWMEPVDLWTRLAIQECESMPGLLQFLSNLIEKFPGISKDLKKRASKASKAAVETIKAYKTFLEQEVLPRANRDWCVGEENFSSLLEIRKLPYTAEEILEMGWALYDKTKEELRALADKIAPGKSFEEVRGILKSDHPKTFEEVLELYTKAVVQARHFVAEKGLASIPSQEEEFVEVKETPGYLAPLIPKAAYIPPAYFDPVKKGIYIVTRPKDASTLQEHSRITIINTSVHEAYPGHHLQMSVASLNSSFIRMFVMGTETIEGWAHYCEQMLLEEGYLEGKEFEFIQKLDALWRATRLIVDVELSRGRMSLDEAVEFIIEKAGKSKETAIATVNHCTGVPGYHLSYLTGKHLVLHLREKMKRKLGNEFSLQFFHDVILKNGSIPYYFLERAMEHEAEKLT